MTNKTKPNAFDLLNPKQTEETKEALFKKEWFIKANKNSVL